MQPIKNISLKQIVAEREKVIFEIKRATVSVLVKNELLLRNNYIEKINHYQHLLDLENIEIEKISNDKLDLMAEGFHLNEDLEDAIIERAELTEDDARALQEKLNVRLKELAKTKSEYATTEVKSYFNRQTMKYSVNIRRKDEAYHIPAPKDLPKPGTEKPMA